MIPVLVTAPATVPVSVPDLKLHLRVDQAEEDAMIGQLSAAAVAHLDGWRGVLGRAIMPQVWAQEFDVPGPWLLAMPDVSALIVTVDGVAVDGADVTVEQTCAGPVVTLDTYGEAARVEYTCGLPAQLLPSAQMAVKLLVAHWYQNREAVAGAQQTTPLAFDALVAALRWGRV